MTTITTLILRLNKRINFIAVCLILIISGCTDNSNNQNGSVKNSSNGESYEVIKSVNDYSFYNKKYKVTIKTVENSHIYKVHMVQDSLPVFDKWIDTEQLRIATDSSKNRTIIKEFERLVELPIEELKSTGGGRSGYTYFKAQFAPLNKSKVVLRFGINYLKDPGKIVILGIYNLDANLEEPIKNTTTKSTLKSHSKIRTEFIQNFLGRYRFENTSSKERYQRIVAAKRYYQIDLKSTEPFTNIYGQNDYNEIRFEFYYYKNRDELKEVRKQMISTYGTAGMTITPKTKGVKNPPQFSIFGDSTLIIGRMSCETMNMDSFWTWDHVKQTMRETFADSTSEIIGNDCANPFFWINYKEE